MAENITSQWKIPNISELVTHKNRSEGREDIKWEIYDKLLIPENVSDYTLRFFQQSLDVNKWITNMKKPGAFPNPEDFIGLILYFDIQNESGAPFQTWGGAQAYSKRYFPNEIFAKARIQVNVSPSQRFETSMKNYYCNMNLAIDNDVSNSVVHTFPDEGGKTKPINLVLPLVLAREKTFSIEMVISTGAFSSELGFVDTDTYMHASCFGYLQRNASG
jgi:hypothetical protein